MAAHGRSRSRRSKKTRRRKGPTKAKSRKILRHGRSRGKKLTRRAKRFFRARSK